MRLQLFIRGQMLLEMEIADPIPNEFISMEESFEIRKKYVDLTVQGLKIKYQSILHKNNWEIFLVSESKMNSPEFQDS